MDSKSGGRDGFIAIHIEGATGPNDVLENKIRLSGSNVRGAIVVEGAGSGLARVNRNEIEYAGPAALDQTNHTDEIPIIKKASWVETYLLDVFSGSTVIGFGAFCAWMAEKLSS
jgi:hypothetical protein